jgi:hypothetical protein
LSRQLSEYDFPWRQWLAKSYLFLAFWQIFVATTRLLTRCRCCQYLLRYILFMCIPFRANYCPQKLDIITGILPTMNMNPCYRNGLSLERSHIIRKRCINSTSQFSARG